MRNVAPGGRGIAALPDAASIAQHQRPPETDRDRANRLRHLHGYRLLVQHETEHLAVIDEVADLPAGDRLPRSEEAPGGELGRGGQGCVLSGGEDDHHLRSLAVVRRGVTDPERGGTQLLESIRAPLSRRSPLTWGIRAPERAEGDARLLRSSTVEEPGEGEPAVLGRGGAERAGAVLPGLVRGERLGSFTTQQLPGCAPEGTRLQPTSQLEELRLDLGASLRRDVGEDLGDQLGVPRSDLPLRHRPPGGLVVTSRPAGRDLLLDLRVRDLLLLGEAALAVLDRGTERRPVGAGRSSGDGGGRSARPHTLELQEWTTDP